MTVEWTSAGLFSEFFSDEYGVVLFKPAKSACHTCNLVSPKT